jgi:arsenate reductase
VDASGEPQAVEAFLRDMRARFPLLSWRKRDFICHDTGGDNTMNVYGITNCDTVKEARAWLAERGVSHRFVDFKKVPPTRDQLAAWCAAAGWQTLLNRRGTTWKKMEPEAQAKVIDTPSAIAVMVANPAAIRRPVVESDAGILVGFNPQEWDRTFPG